MDQKNIFSRIRAFVFDMDGTLVDSGLDFDLMRKDLRFPKNVPILEHLDTIEDQVRLQECKKIIHAHEKEGAQRACLFPYVREVLVKINKKYPTAILTRNSREITEFTFERLNLNFEMVLTRDDCLPKPHPEGLQIISKKWSLNCNELIYIGDYQFDIETAKNAGSFSGLFMRKTTNNFSLKPDISFRCYSELLNII